MEYPEGMDSLIQTSDQFGAVNTPGTPRSGKYTV